MHLVQKCFRTCRVNSTSGVHLKGTVILLFYRRLKLVSLITGGFFTPASIKGSFKGTVSRDFRLLFFFMNQFPPSPLVYHQGCFDFFRKFAEIFAAQGAPPVSLIPVVHLDLRISPRIFEKIRIGPNAILWGWGKTDSSKKPEAKNLVTLSLKSFYI